MRFLLIIRRSAGISRSMSCERLVGVRSNTSLGAMPICLPAATNAAQSKDGSVSMSGFMKVRKVPGSLAFFLNYRRRSAAQAPR